MSMEALNWAMPIQLEKSSWKFVLVCMANRVRSEALSFQSVAQLVEDTCLNRKTVLAAIEKLCETGLIVDTGERVGATKQIIVYKLALGSSPKNGTVSGAVERSIVEEHLEKKARQSTACNSTEKGTVIQNQTVPILAVNSPKNGTVIDFETVPKTTCNSPVFDSKESRFFPKESQKRDTESEETYKTQKKRKERARQERDASLAEARAVPALDVDAFDRFERYRNEIGEPIKTPSLVMMARKVARFGAQQSAVVDQTIENSWTGLFDLKQPVAARVNGAQPSTRKTRFEELYSQIGNTGADDGQG